MLRWRSAARLFLWSLWFVDIWLVMRGASIAMAVESGDIAWGAEVIFVWAWLVVVLTIGATNLLYLMLRHGEAARVSSLFYLTPPTAVLLGWLSYGETMGLVAMGGFLVAVAGVFLVTRAPREAP